MKIVLFVFTLYCLITQFKDIKSKFKTFKEKVSVGLNKIDESDRNDTYLLIAKFAMFIFILIYYVIVFNVVEIKIFQIIVCLCFIWSMYDFSLYTKVYKGIENKAMNSKAYSIISWILDVTFYGYIIYYIILNW